MDLFTLIRPNPLFFLLVPILYYLEVEPFGAKEGIKKKYEYYYI